MPQYDRGPFDPNTDTGTGLCTYLNSIEAAYFSCHLGAAAPPYATDGMLWSQDVDPYRVVNFRGSIDIPLFKFSKSSTASVQIGADASNIGIGTVSPTEKLHLYNSSGTADVKVKYQNGSRQWSLGLRGSSQGFALQDDSAGTTPLFVDTSGRLGIGNSSPTTKIHCLSGGSTTNVQATFQNGGQSWTVGNRSDSPYDNSFIIQNDTANTLDLNILTNGNVGVGIRVPLERLHIYRNTTNISVALTNDTKTFKIGVRGDTGDVVFGIMGPDRTTGSERILATVDSGGEVAAASFLGKIKSTNEYNDIGCISLMFYDGPLVAPNGLVPGSSLLYAAANQFDRTWIGGEVAIGTWKNMTGKNMGLPGSSDPLSTQVGIFMRVA